MFHEQFLLKLCKGSLGARINELKQRVIAENPHRYAVAVPRESHPAQCISNATSTSH